MPGRELYRRKFMNNIRDAIDRLRQSKKLIPIVRLSKDNSFIVDEAVFILTKPSVVEKRDIGLLLIYLMENPNGDLRDSIFSLIQESKGFFSDPLLFSLFKKSN